MNDIADQVEPVAFLDGAVLPNGEVCIISAIWGLEDSHDRPTRLLYCDNGSFRHIDVEANIVSVATIANTVVGLTSDGRALIIENGRVREMVISRFDYGSLNRLHAEGSCVYACGTQGQVYKMANWEPWEKMDDGIFTTKPTVDSVQLRDIAGSMKDGLFTCGMCGAFFKHEGHRWIPSVVPTNCHFEQVLILNGEVWACGSSGLLLRGHDDLWTIVDTNSEDDFWGMAAFQGYIYLASFDGLWCCEPNGDVTQVETKLEPPPTTYRLTSSSRELWSFGLTDVCRFDGRTWMRTEYPGNC